MFRCDHHHQGAYYFNLRSLDLPVTVAARSEAYVYGRLPAENVGSNSTGGMDVLSVVSVVCCQVEVSATD
jgi:hypothetical protein